MVWADTPSSVLGSGEGGHPCCVSDLDENASCVSPLNKMLALVPTEVYM